jgi:hypothetical protein
VQDQKEDEEEQEGAIWRAGSRHTRTLDAHRDVGYKGREDREGEEEEEDRREKGEAMKRAGRRRGHRACRITKQEKRGIKKVLRVGFFSPAAGSPATRT